MINQILVNIIRALATTAIWILITYISYSVGRRILTYLQIEDRSRLDRVVFAIPLGLGVISLGIFLLGVAGQFKIGLMITWLIVLAIWSRDDLIASLRNTPSLLKAGKNSWRNANYQGKGLIILSFIILTLTFLQALTPVWDYDGLMYHLEGPRQFLEANRILLLQHPYQANGPMLIEMLYSIPVGLGLEPLSKLIHMTFGILLILATYSLGERYLGTRKGWIPAAIMLASPIIVSLAGYAYSDLGWALYTLLGMYSILIWSDSNRFSYLIVAGIFSGLMIGSKYLALGYFLILILIIIWLDRGKEWHQRFVNIFLYGGIAFLIGFPWYLKNIIYSGNPVYPLFFGGPGWPHDRVQFASNFLSSFGTGKSFVDYLLLPYNLYVHQNKYSTFIGSRESLSPLFLFVLVVPFLRNKSRAIVVILFLTVMGFVYWALTSQQIRLLLPLFPFFSILASKALVDITSPIKSRKLNKVLIPGVMGGLIFFY